MNVDGQRITDNLLRVSAERARRAGDARLAERTQAIKQWQHARFERTYADMLASARYGAASRFFLADLYGPTDFTRRDQEFGRIVPALVRLFPQEIVSTVMALSELHALSEELDTAMAEAVAPGSVDDETYGRAWRQVGRPDERERQIALVLEVGGALERYTRSRLLRHSLRLMRRPAQAVGLGTLQEFLERGFDTFSAMQGAAVFLDTVGARERALAARLFAGGGVDVPAAAAAGADAGADAGAGAGAGEDAADTGSAIGAGPVRNGREPGPGGTPAG